MSVLRPADGFRAEIIRLGAVLAILPPVVFGLYVALMPSAPLSNRFAMAAMLGLSAAAAGYSLYRLNKLTKRRIDEPLAYFRSTLEDISEGFVLDRIPEEKLKDAEPAIADAFRQMILMNRMLLKNVDNLEQGYEEERQAKLAQQALTQAYQRFVPKDFISFLQKSSITEVKLGDHVRTEMTILVSDIRGFTAMSEKMTPEENFRLINSYLYVMEPIVSRNHGFIDKYMGDSVMALFHRSPDHAVIAALQMVDRLKHFNERRQAEGKEPLRIGIGLNTGTMMLGIVGGEDRMEGTVISDAVNLAARMEDLNKTYGTAILMSEFTRERLRHPTRFRIRAVDRVQVKGKTNAVDVYEITGMAEPQEAPEHPIDEAGESR
ncbi:adenylate/guanylate cyclase domain-containing protein [Cohnella caldifontis]|uniref:adenylate/guanylate cyclase domain-containing protein n=1 Tax=Cohnella caldifontis TaxID=3027471 RepID=UPI0023EC526F|nr:adenylate/guanylate cyclase domain-containing protein [Cohnella sp. YIM B05605]